MMQNLLERQNAFIPLFGGAIFFKLMSMNDELKFKKKVSEISEKIATAERDFETAKTLI
jgi:hypothetical protein